MDYFDISYVKRCLNVRCGLYKVSNNMIFDVMCV